MRRMAHSVVSRMTRMMSAHMGIPPPVDDDEEPDDGNPLSR